MFIYFRKLGAYFIYSNLFIALIALLILYQTNALFIGGTPNRLLLNFVFFSTICSYNFHYYLTDHSVLPSGRVAWILRFRPLMIFLFFVGLAGATWYGWELRAHWPWLIPAVIATFLYSAPKIPHRWFRLLREVAIGKTIFLAFIWMYVTSVLPLVVADLEWNWAHRIYCASQFFFIYSICILFDYRDREDDKADGVRSLITYLSEINIRRLFYFSAIFAFAGNASLLLTGMNWWPITILQLPVLIVLLLYKKASSDFSDMLYYFCLDGLMGLSGLLLLLVNI